MPMEGVCPNMLTQVLDRIFAEVYPGGALRPHLVVVPHGADVEQVAGAHKVPVVTYCPDQGFSVAHGAPVPCRFDELVRTLFRTHCWPESFIIF